MKELDKYIEARKEILEYFSLDDDEEYPIKDCRKWYWKVTSDDVFYGFTKKDVIKDIGLLSNEIHMIRRTDDYTIILRDTYNYSYLMIFDNSKEVKDV